MVLPGFKLQRNLIILIQSHSVIESPERVQRGKPWPRPGIPCAHHLGPLWRDLPHKGHFSSDANVDRGQTVPGARTPKMTVPSSFLSFTTRQWHPCVYTNFIRTYATSHIDTYIDYAVLCCSMLCYAMHSKYKNKNKQTVKKQFCVCVCSIQLTFHIFHLQSTQVTPNRAPWRGRGIKGSGRSLGGGSHQLPALSWKNGTEKVRSWRIHY